MLASLHYYNLFTTWFPLAPPPPGWPTIPSLYGNGHLWVLQGSNDSRGYFLTSGLKQITPNKMQISLAASPCVVRPTPNENGFSFREWAWELIDYSLASRTSWCGKNLNAESKRMTLLLVFTQNQRIL